MAAPTDRASSCLDAALRYAKRGWRVIPVDRKKEPLTGHGSHDATTDEATIRSWWERWPSACVAVATGPESGIWILDVDAPKGGIESLEALRAEHGSTGDGPTERTGRNGFHLVYRWDDRVRQTAGFRPGLDTRGRGGYFVAAPSIHENGNVYAWVGDTETRDPQPAPEWLIDLVGTKDKGGSVPTRPATISSQTSAYGRKALAGLFDELRGIQPSRRDTVRNAIGYRCGRLVAGGHVTRDDAVSMLFVACQENGLVDDLGEGEVKKRIEAAIEAGVAAGPVGPAPKAPRVVLTPDGVETSEDPDEQATDVGNGRRLIRLYGHDLRWSKAHGWLIYDGERWARDDTGRVMGFAKESARLLRAEAETLSEDDARRNARKFALASEKADRIRAAVAMAQTEEGVAISAERFDADPMALAVSNGVIDLTRGTLRPHRREDLISHVAFTRFDESATCPRWLSFLDETFQGDQDLVGFLRRAVGYSLTGSTKEQVLFLCHGIGSNGKSTMLGTLRLLLGDHATHAAFETFLAHKNAGTGPRGDLARLAGVRLVTSTEPEGSARFSESTIKAITGGDPVTCAYKFQDEFTYTPQFKLWLGANHKPRIRGTDHAIWRRFNLIPFERVFLSHEMDRNLPIVLSTELPGILLWAIEGCLSWQRDGLAPPEVVVGATAKYREEQDSLAEFIAESCVTTPGSTCYATALYDAYRKWAEGEGDEPVSKKMLGLMLEERGYKRNREGGSGARTWEGICPRSAL